MQDFIEKKSPRVPQNNFGWRLVDFGLKTPQRYIIGIRASNDTHGCRNYTSYQLSRRNGGKMPAVKLLHQQSEPLLRPTV
jgi:hypothetical protein